MVHDHDLPLGETPLARQLAIDQLVDHLHLEEVVAAEVEPHLGARELGPQQLPGDHVHRPRGVRSIHRDAPVPLHALERVFGQLVLLQHRPATTDQHVQQLVAVEAVAVAVQHVLGRMRIDAREQAAQLLARQVVGLKIGGHHAHPVVHRHRSEFRHQRAAGLDRDAGRHFHLRLLVDIRKRQDRIDVGQRGHSVEIALDRRLRVAPDREPHQFAAHHHAARSLGSRGDDVQAVGLAFFGARVRPPTVGYRD